MEEISDLEQRVEAAPTKEWPDAELEAIYREHSKGVYYLALRFLGDAAQAEDVTHDVFIKAFRNLGKFRGQATLKTWLYRITVNHCQNYKQSWRERNVIPSADEVLQTFHGSVEDHPLRVLEIKELGERIQSTMAELPEEYRLILLLVAEEKFSYEEVGVLTEQTADAVRGKLFRARRMFIAAFEKNK